MFDLWDHCASGWVSGKGRGAVWEDIDFPKQLKPEYLMSSADYLETITDRRSAKVAFKDISTAIHKRTMMSAVVPDLPSVNASPVLTCSSAIYSELLQSALGSLVFDYVAKFKIGYLHLNYFIIKECPLVDLERMKVVADGVADASLRLSCSAEIFAPLWMERQADRGGLSWRQCWAVTKHERLRLRAIIDASLAYVYGLSLDDYRWLLADTDHPAAFLAVKANAKRLDPKRFWRVDKALDPELRQTVLAQIAFANLMEIGPTEFFGQNAGQGWLLPEALRLADHGLGRDQRAEEAQPVARRLGPRFEAWQLEEDSQESWAECRAHAEIISRIVPKVVAATAPDTSNSQAKDIGVSEKQGGLF